MTIMNFMDSSTITADEEMKRMVFCAVILHCMITGLETIQANKMKFGLNYAPGVRSISRSVDLQSSVLPLLLMNNYDEETFNCTQDNFVLYQYVHVSQHFTIVFTMLEKIKHQNHSSYRPYKVKESHHTHCNTRLKSNSSKNSVIFNPDFLKNKIYQKVEREIISREAKGFNYQTYQYAVRSFCL